MVSVSDNREAVRAMLLSAAVILIAACMTLLGLGGAAPLTPTIQVTAARSRPATPLDPIWDTVPSAAVTTTSPAQNRVRPVAVRAMQDAQNLFLLVQWRDKTPDRSFAGSHYAPRTDVPIERAPMSTLLRDELHVWVSKPVPAVREVATARTHAHWIWRSQWQSDAMSRPTEEVRRAYGTHTVDYYPIEGDGAFPARYVLNPNAITEPSTPAVWFFGDHRSVYEPTRSEPLDSRATWRKGFWYVQFRVPKNRLPQSRGRLTLLVGVTDGGAKEVRGEVALAPPVTLLLTDGPSKSGGYVR